MTTDIEQIKTVVLPILHRYGATRAGIFGSCARGEMREDSDIDLLVELGPKISLRGFVHIKHELERALGREVDLVEYVALKPRIRQRILDEEIPIL